MIDRIGFWVAIVWVAICVAPYIYAARDLIAWR
jgi:hypothetical protein